MRSVWLLTSVWPSDSREFDELQKCSEMERALTPFFHICGSKQGHSREFSYCLKAGEDRKWFYKYTLSEVTTPSSEIVISDDCRKAVASLICQVALDSSPLETRRLRGLFRRDYTNRLGTSPIVMNHSGFVYLPLSVSLDSFQAIEPPGTRMDNIDQAIDELVETILLPFACSLVQWHILSEMSSRLRRMGKINPLGSRFSWLPLMFLTLPLSLSIKPFERFRESLLKVIEFVPGSVSPQTSALRPSQCISISEMRKVFDLDKRLNRILVDSQVDRTEFLAYSSIAIATLSLLVSLISIVSSSRSDVNVLLKVINFIL